MKIKISSQFYVFLTALTSCLFLYGLGEKGSFLGNAFGKIFVWIPGDIFDGSLNNWFLERNYQFLLGGGNFLSFDEVFNANIYWPEKNTLAWSDNWILLTPIYIVLRQLASPGLAFTYLITLCLIANVMSCYRLCRHATNREVYKLIAACLSGFSLTVLARFGHAQIMPAFAGVLAIDCFINSLSYKYSKKISSNDQFKNHKNNLLYINIPSVFNGIIWLLLQIGIGFYQGMFFTLASACLLAILIFNRLFIKDIKFMFYFGSIKKILVFNTVKNFSKIITFIFLLGVNFLIYRQYLIFSKISGGRSYGEVAKMLPKFWSLGFNTLSNPGSVSLPAPIQSINFNTYPGPFWEHSMFPGYTFVILLFLAILFAVQGCIPYKRYQRMPWKVLTLGQTCALLLLISMGIGGSTPIISIWLFLWKFVPGISALRAVARIGIPIALMLSPLLAWSLHELNNRLDKKNMIITLSLLFMIYLAGNVSTGIMRFEKETYQSNLEIFTSKISKIIKEKDCKAFYLASPNTNSWMYDRAHPQLIAMWASIKLGIPTASGYSGHDPKDGWNHMMNRTQLEDWLREKGLNKDEIKNVCLISGEEVF